MFNGRRAAIAVAAVALLAIPAAAQASTHHASLPPKPQPSHVLPAGAIKVVPLPYSLTNGACYAIENIYGYGDVDFDSDTNLWYTANGFYAKWCAVGSGAWQEMQIPEVGPAYCASFYFAGKLGSDVVTWHTCNSANYELWSVQHLTGNDWIIYNQYADGAYSCAGGYHTVLTTNGYGSNVYMRCPNLGTGIVGQNQVWEPVKVS